MSLGAQSSDNGQGAFSEVTEECDECDRETVHDVQVELRTENPDSDFATFSREPYRVAECQFCGAVQEVRMSDV